jgi:NitT/TauT family transport system substrate-binding protein
MNGAPFKRARFVALAASACFFPRAARAQSTELHPVRVGAIPFDNAAEVFYARQLGSFEKAGIDLEIMPLTSGAAITAGVAGGAIDIGFSNLFSVTQAYSRGIPLVAIAPATLQVTGSPNTGIIVEKTSPAKSGKDLDGKTVAVDSLKGVTNISTAAWVDKNGGDSTTLKFIEMPEPAMTAALAAGRVDAATLQLTNVDLGPASSQRMLADPYEAIAARFTPSVWFTTRAWLAGHHDDAKRYAAIMRDTATWANANHTASGDILATIAKLTPDRMASLTMHRSPYAEILDAKMIQPVIDVAARYGLISKAFPASEIMWTA